MRNITMTIVEGFFRQITKLKENINFKIQQPKTNYLRMRNNQFNVYDEKRDSRNLLLNQPPGSGKSVTVAFCMGKRIENNPNEKVLIVVPQTFIAKSFKNLLLRYEDGSEIHWDIHKDFCEKIFGKKTRALINFLKKKDFSDDPKERIALTTHSAFAQLCKKVSDIDDIFENTTVVIDEAHHVLYSDNEASNRIGSLIGNIIDNQESMNTSLWLVTATPYRGDNNPLIPKEIMDTFDKVFLPFDEHWETNIQYIENFSFDFVIYKKNQILQDVRNLIKLGKRKSIIFCPFNGHLLEKGDKRNFRDLLIKEIHKEWPECKILDLIETDGRYEKKQILLDNEDSKHVDIILTLKIFDEGSDWVHAEQCIDLNPVNSLRVQYQRFGRLWRDYFNKHSVYYYMFLPYEADFENEEDRRRHLSKSYNIFVASLLLQEIVEPLTYPSKLKNGNIKKVKLNPFEEAVPDDGQRQDILQKIIYKLLSFKNNNENPEPNEVKEWIGCVLTSNHITENQDKVINHIAKILRRNSDRNNVIKRKPIWEDSLDLGWMIDEGFDKIWTNEIFDSMLVIGTNTSGIKDFEEFRKIILCKKSIPENVKDAEKLANENNGVLPIDHWLKKNGYSGLMTCKYRNPSYLAHIKQLSRSEIAIYKNVKDAEKLANKNNGILPGDRKIRDKGKSGIIYCIKKYPDAFSHIKRKLTKSIPEHVKDAEKLANENNDILMNDNQLLLNGYRSLVTCKSRHANDFAHIKQIKYRKGEK